LERLLIIVIWTRAGRIKGLRLAIMSIMTWFTTFKAKIIASLSLLLLERKPIDIKRVRDFIGGGALPLHFEGGTS